MTAPECNILFTMSRKYGDDARIVTKFTITIYAGNSWFTRQWFFPKIWKTKKKKKTFDADCSEHCFFLFHVRRWNHTWSNCDWLGIAYHFSSAIRGLWKLINEWITYFSYFRLKIGEIHLDQWPFVWLQGMRSARFVAHLRQWLVLDSWIAEIGTDHRSLAERLVRQWRHWTTATGQPWIATRWRQRELLSRFEQFLQRWRSLARCCLPSSQTMGVRGEWCPLEICSLHKPEYQDLI